MYKLKKVEIFGFWGHHTLITNFHKDANIFIGKNGTGKTTFMNLLQSVVAFDLESISKLQFEEIIIHLQEKRSIRKISVKKNIDELKQFKSITYKLGRESFSFPLLFDDIKYDRYKRGRLHSSLIRDIDNLKDELKAIVNISFLSVNREDSFDYDEYRERKRDNKSPVDVKLEKLMQDFTTYQLELETEISQLGEKFQGDVLKTMLYNEDYDSVLVAEPLNLNKERLSQIKSGLTKAYRDLGLLDKEVKEAISNHVNQIGKASEAINNYIKDNSKSVYPNDVTPLTLYRRTRKIIKLSNSLEQEKEKKYKPINDYLNLLKEFIEEKTFETSKSNRYGLSVLKNSESFPIDKLSSGEKQLIILLTEALLQKNKETVFFADEPELSLHISWQRKVIPSLIKLNPNAQLIVATHSPEIVGNWRENSINMSSLFNG